MATTPVQRRPVRATTGETATACPPRTGFQRLFLPGAGRTASLDGLRGLAVMIVLASHLSNNRLLPQPGLAGAGKAGVYLFFVLSAFLLTAGLLRRGPDGLRSSAVWIDYALRRVLRIWPLYLVVLVASWWATTRMDVEWWHYQIDTVSLWQHLTLREGMSVLWSIPVEFTFYVWLPPVALGLAWMRWRQTPMWAQALVIAGVVLLATLTWPPSASRTNDVRVGPYLGIFLCGAFAAALDLWIREHKPHPAAWAVGGLLAITAALIGVPAVWASVRGVPFDPSTGQRAFLAWGLVWSALLLAVLHGPRWLRAPFASTPMRLVGAISFSLYLWHLPVLHALRAAGLLGQDPGAAGAVLVTSCALLVAALSFLLFERPWQGLRYGGIHPRPL